GTLGPGRGRRDAAAATRLAADRSDLAGRPVLPGLAPFRRAAAGRSVLRRQCPAPPLPAVQPAVPPYDRDLAAAGMACRTPASAAERLHLPHVALRIDPRFADARGASLQHRRLGSAADRCHRPGLSADA